MTPPPHLPSRPFGKRLTPPLTADQKIAVAAAAREAERAAQRARTKAYMDAKWEENLSTLEASVRSARGAMARRRLGHMGFGMLQGLAGFAVGLRLGR